MNRISKLFVVFSLLALFLLTLTTSASAFDGRSGENVIIKSDEVIDDDLYITAGTFILDGTVNGDLIVVGRSLTINGTVTSAIRTAGYALLLGEQASIGGDLIAVSYSLESREGSKVVQDLLFAGDQVLLAGDVSRHTHVQPACVLESAGTVGGSVSAGVGEADTGYAGRSAYSVHAPISDLHSSCGPRVHQLANRHKSMETCSQTAPRACLSSRRSRRRNHANPAGRKCSRLCSGDNRPKKF